MNNPLLVTLDNNSIIALENGEEPNATAMKQLIAFHRQGIIKIIVGWRTLFVNTIIRWWKNMVII